MWTRGGSIREITEWSEKVGEGKIQSQKRVGVLYPYQTGRDYRLTVNVKMKGKERVKQGQGRIRK